MMRPTNPETVGAAVGGALLHFALSIVAVLIGLAVFFGLGVLGDFWDFAVTFVGLGAASGLVFMWRRRLYFAGAAVLGLAGGILGMLGGGPDVGNAPLWSVLAALSLFVLFWPIFEFFSEAD